MKPPTFLSINAFAAAWWTYDMVGNRVPPHGSVEIRIIGWSTKKCRGPPAAGDSAVKAIGRKRRWIATSPCAFWRPHTFHRPPSSPPHSHRSTGRGRGEASACLSLRFLTIHPREISTPVSSEIPSCHANSSLSPTVTEITAPLRESHTMAETPADDGETNIAHILQGQYNESLGSSPPLYRSSLRSSPRYDSPSACPSGPNVFIGV